MEREPYEIVIEGQSYNLELGQCAIKLFRSQQEVDYIIISSDEKRIRGFGNALMCRYLAGYMISRDEDGDLSRSTTIYDKESFRHKYGWNPLVIEQEEPSEEEIEAYLDVEMKDFDAERTEL